MKTATKKHAPPSQSLHEFGAILATIASKVSRSLVALWNALPESYAIASEEDLKKMIGDAENFVVFNGRIIRVNQSKKSDGNLSTQDV